MRRTVAPIYGLFLLETLVWIAIIPLAPTFADEFALSGVETGMILASSSLAALVVALPLGVLADRFGARRVTIASACLFTLATLGQGLADEFPTLLAARLAFGIAFGALWGAGASWLSDSLSEERRTGALALATTVAGLGFTIGPALAGVLADRYETGTPFLVLAIAAAAVTAALFVTAPPATAHAPQQRLREALRLARADELVLAGIAIIVLIGLVGGGVNLLVPLQLRENAVSAAKIGLLFSVASAVYTVVSAGVARLGARSATLRVGGYAALLTGISFLLVLTSSSTVAAVAFVLVRAPPWSTMDTIIYPLAAAGAHRSAIGRGSVMGLVMLGWAAASTVGPLLAGGIADAAGKRAAYVVLMAFCGLVGGWLLYVHARVARSGSEVELDRLYGARDLAELRSEYDRIATAYDTELVDGMGYNAPGEVATVAQRLLPADARILDVGAGTGLLGIALTEAGFARLDGLDLSPGMLAEARRKAVYGDLREATLGEVLDYESGGYDGVLASGVLTTGHAPATCLDELVRITRTGGHVIFTLRSDAGGPPGFEEKMGDLAHARRWELVERGDEFQAMPIGEPNVLLRVWAFRVI
ncbi:MAG TPA: MFS transporter [Gaiellaceae bacterium]|jgi:MFS family permease|nr:MFS transporter [Gaiellaceae bacterium]